LPISLFFRITPLEFIKRGKQSLTDSLFDRIQFAKDRNFTSLKELKRPITQKFPGRLNKTNTILFEFLIIDSLMPSRRLQEVLRKWEAVINGIT